MFRTQFQPDSHKTIPAEAGSRSEPDMRLRISQDGAPYFEQVGTLDLYGQIQSHADSVDINLIVKRCLAGDVSALNRIEGIYGDFSELPTTYAGMLDMVMRGQEYFDSLSLDERSKYDYSFGRWLANFDFQQDVKLPQTATGSVAPDASPTTSTSGAD